MKKDKILQIYYFATPVFFMFEHFFGFNVRVILPEELASLEDIYYLVCFMGAFLFFKHKMAAALFSLTECSINIFMLLLSVMLPLVMLGDLGDEGVYFCKAELVHFMIAGGFLLINFYHNPLINRR